MNFKGKRVLFVDEKEKYPSRIIKKTMENERTSHCLCIKKEEQSHLKETRNDVR